MASIDDLTFVGQLIDTYAQTGRRMGTADDPEDGGVPFDMRVGAVTKDGWVAWNVLPSTLAESEVQHAEQAFGITFPPLFRAYLLARYHLFDSLHSRKHDEQVMLTCVPSVDSLGPLTETLSAWQPLLAAGYFPFGSWGDDYGPICLDGLARRSDGDCPVVWLDHEALLDFDIDAIDRAQVAPLAQLLYESFRECLMDLFGRDE